VARFTVGIVGRGKDVHAGAFEDIAHALSAVLRQLGHEVSGFDNPGRLIMFGTHVMSDPSGVMPPDAIIFNTEQVAAMNPDKRVLAGLGGYKDHVVWDYSRANIEALHLMGFNRTVHCPIGYTHTMTKSPIYSGLSKDIDVLFYGSINTRRREILDELDKLGLKVVRLFGTYGARRDMLIARSKMALNLHFYEGAVFEIFRVSHLLANNVCVVSEDGSADPELEKLAEESTMYVPRSSIAQTCFQLASDTPRTQMLAERGFIRFCRERFLDSVAEALRAS
jgi:hypothetical protein